MTLRQRAARALGALLLVGALFWLGVLLHEAGHTVCAWAFGARLTYLNVLGLQIVPQVRPDIRPGYFGYMSYSGSLTNVQSQIVSLWGSLATLLAASIAQAVLWLSRPRRGAVRLAVLTICFFWIDLLYHTLPTLGIPLYLLSGSVERRLTGAEAYLAAVGLGMPGVLFQVATVGISALMPALTLVRWYRLGRFDTLTAAIPAQGEPPAHAT